MNKLTYLIFTTLLFILLNGCSSDSDSSDTGDKGQLRIYNGIGNSASIYLEVDDSALTYTNFSYASSIYSYSPDSYSLNFNRLDANYEYQELITTTTSINSNYQNLILLTGTQELPEIVEFSYDATSKTDLELDDDDDGEKQFELYLGNLASTNSSYEFYIAQADLDFDQAELLTRLSSNQFSDKYIFTQDDYKIFAVDTSTQTIVYESSTISFSYLDTFILLFRENFGPSQFALDRLASATFTTAYLDANASANIQFYQSESQYSETNVFLTIPIETPSVDSLLPNQMSNAINVEANTYILNTITNDDTSEALIENLVLNISSGDEKFMIFYNDLNDTPQAKVLNKQSRPLAYESDITILNLVKSEDETVDFYFVPEGETIGTTDFYLGGLDFADSTRSALVEQPYQVFATIEDDNGNQRLIFQSELIEFESTENYLLILQEDINAASGYALQIIKE